MESFTTFGVWWSPDTTEFRFDAKLEFDPVRGAVLKPTSHQYNAAFMDRYGQRLFGSLTVDIDGATHDMPILVGTAEGREFTLLHCQLHALGGIIGLVIEGKRFDHVEDAYFPAYSMSYTGLDEWGASGRLRSFLQRHEDGKHYFQLSYETPSTSEQPITLELRRVFLEIRRSITSQGSARNEASLIESTEFRIIPKPNTTLSAIDVVETISNLLRNFLMLATWKSVGPLYLRAWNDAEDIAKGQATIYWRGKGMRQEVSSYDYDEWLFTMLDLASDLEAVIQVWERDYEIFSPLIRNYFSHRYMSETFLEVEFLAYMQALEAYSKKRGYKGKLKGLLRLVRY